MRPGEYEAMARAERGHWWYRGLRDALGRVLTRPALALAPHPRVLDAGCGTGENLRFLHELLQPADLAGFDHSEQAVEFARAKAPFARVYRDDVCDPRGDEGTALDLLVLMDLLQIPGMERAREGMGRLVGRLAPGGLLVLNLPAYDWLHSEHDVAVHTQHRFTAGRVRRYLAELDLDVVVLTYRLCLLFPLLVASRLPRKIGLGSREQTARSDLHELPGAVANRTLGAVVRLENALIGRGLRMPWGSSVFAVGRRRG